MIAIAIKAPIIVPIMFSIVLTPFLSEFCEVEAKIKSFLLCQLCAYRKLFCAGCSSRNRLTGVERIDYIFPVVGADDNPCLIS